MNSNRKKQKTQALIPNQPFFAQMLPFLHLQHHFYDYFCVVFPLFFPSFPADTHPEQHKAKLQSLFPFCSPISFFPNTPPDPRNSTAPGPAKFAFCHVFGCPTCAISVSADGCCGPKDKQDPHFATRLGIRHAAEGNVS